MKHKKLTVLSALAFGLFVGASASQAQQVRTLPVPPTSATSGVAITLAGGSYLGVQTENVTNENFAKYNLREPRGVVVTKVIENSPAAKAGFLAGDVIVAFEGEEIKSEMKLTRLIQEVTPDQKAKITILRGGIEQEITVIMGKRELPKFRAFGSGNGTFTLPSPEEQQLLRIPPTPPEGFEFRRFPQGEGFVLASGGRRIGVVAQPLTKQLADYFGVTDGKGLLVSEVVENNAAAKAGLRAGDVILDIDGEIITSQTSLVRALNKKSEGDVSITILRDKQRQIVRVTPEGTKKQ